MINKTQYADAKIGDPVYCVIDGIHAEIKYDLCHETMDISCPNKFDYIGYGIISRISSAFYKDSAKYHFWKRNWKFYRYD